MHKPIETGWPAITGVVVLLLSISIGWLWISGDTPEAFYEHWKLLVWSAGVLVSLCILGEMARLKWTCPLT
jgi:hypothetical protein